MPAASLAIKGLGALVAAFFLFSSSLNPSLNPSLYAKSVQVTDVRYNDKQLIYYLNVNDGKKTIPVKVEYNKPNRLKIHYKKDGNKVEFDFERDLDKPLPPFEKEMIVTIKNEVLRHSNSWLKNGAGRARNILIDFRDTLMKTR